MENAKATVAGCYLADRKDLDAFRSGSRANVSAGGAVLAVAVSVVKAPWAMPEEEAVCFVMLPS